MTNKEAIEILETHKCHWERLLDEGICDVLEGGNTIQALQKAIFVLKLMDDGKCPAGMIYKAYCMQGGFEE